MKTAPINVKTLFSSVQFDNEIAKTYAALTEGFQHIASMIDASVTNSEDKAMILSKLNESYFWAGAALKNVQVQKNSPVQQTTAAA